MFPLSDETQGTTETGPCDVSKLSGDRRIFQVPPNLQEWVSDSQAWDTIKESILLQSGIFWLLPVSMYVIGHSSEPPVSSCPFTLPLPGRKVKFKHISAELSGSSQWCLCHGCFSCLMCVFCFVLVFSLFCSAIAFNEKVAVSGCHLTNPRPKA